MSRLLMVCALLCVASVAEAAKYRVRRVDARTVEVTKVPLIEDPNKIVFGTVPTMEEMEAREARWDTTGKIACKAEIKALRAWQPAAYPYSAAKDCEAIPTVGVSQVVLERRAQCFEERAALPAQRRQIDEANAKAKASLEESVAACFAAVATRKEARIAAAPTATLEQLKEILPEEMRLPEETARIKELQK